MKRDTRKERRKKIVLPLLSVSVCFGIGLLSAHIERCSVFRRRDFLHNCYLDQAFSCMINTLLIFSPRLIAQPGLYFFFLSDLYKLHHWFKSYGDFAEWVDFSYWLSCIGKDLHSFSKASLFGKRLLIFLT